MILRLFKLNWMTYPVSSLWSTVWWTRLTWGRGATPSSSAPLSASVLSSWSGMSLADEVNHRERNLDCRTWKAFVIFFILQNCDVDVRFSIKQWNNNRRNKVLLLYRYWHVMHVIKSFLKASSFTLQLNCKVTNMTIWVLILSGLRWTFSDQNQDGECVQGSLLHDWLGGVRLVPLLRHRHDRLWRGSLGGGRAHPRLPRDDQQV